MGVNTEPHPQLHTSNPAAPLTLADLIGKISSEHSLPAKKWTAMRCSLKRFAEICEMHPEQITANARTFRMLLREHLAPSKSLKRARVAAIRSDLGTALQLAGLGEGCRPHGLLLSAEYQTLLNAAHPRFVQLGLTRFFRYCSHRNIHANEIKQQTFCEFRDYLERATLLEDPLRSANIARTTWNTCVEQIDRWPQVYLQKASTKCNGVQFDLPKIFLSELARYAAFLEKRHPHQNGGLRATSLRRSTINELSKTIRRLGRLLMECGIQPQSLRELVAPCNAAKILHRLREQGTVRRQYIYSEGLALQRLAKTWCGNSAQEISELHRLVRKYRPPYRPRAPRAQQLAAVLFDRDRQLEMLRLPRCLIGQLPSWPFSRRPIAAQVAAAIEIVLTAPIEPRFLATLKIGTTFLKTREHPTIYRISIPPSPCGRDPALEYVLPADSSALVQQYIEQFRDSLCEPHIEWLFPGNGDKPKNVAAFSTLITEYIFRSTGQHLTVSGLRYLVGALYLLKHRQMHETVRQAFGHKHLFSTRLKYQDLDAISAGERFDRVVLRQKRATGAR